MANQQTIFDKFSAQRPTSRNVYSDFMIDLNFHPNTNTLMVNKDIQAVNRAMKNLLLTNKYERLFNPTLGSNIRSILFENMSPFIEDDLREMIKETIENYEPRVSILEVEVVAKPDSNGFDITIQYVMKNIAAPISITIPIFRER